MARHKKHPKIEVRTVPNGYTLTIEGHKHEYMYFSTTKLLEGFLGHVGMNIDERLKPNEVLDLVDTATRWKDIEKSTAEIRRLQRELDAMTRKRNGLVRQLMDERHDYNDLRADMETIHREAQGTFGSELMAVMSGKCLHMHHQKRPISAKEFGINCEAITDDPLSGDSSLAGPMAAAAEPSPDSAEPSPDSDND